MGSGTYAYASLRLQMESTSDYSVVDIAANPISDAGIFLPQVPPSSYEEWWSFLTSNIPPDSLCPEVCAEVDSQVSCGVPSLRLLTRIFRNTLLVSVHQYNVLLFGASIHLKPEVLHPTQPFLQHLTFRYCQCPRMSLARQLLCNIKQRVHQETIPSSSRKRELPRKCHRSRLNDPLTKVKLLKDHTRAKFVAKDMHNYRGLDGITGRCTILVRARTATSNGAALTSIGLTSRKSTVTSSPTWR